MCAVLPHVQVVFGSAVVTPVQEQFCHMSKLWHLVPKGGRKGSREGERELIDCYWASWSKPTPVDSMTPCRLGSTHYHTHQSSLGHNAVQDRKPYQRVGLGLDPRQELDTCVEKTRTFCPFFSARGKSRTQLTV